MRILLPPGMGLHILLVDDVADARDSMKVLLELDGHQVDTACDGQQAIEAARKLMPDLIFMDIGMPIMDGLTATRHIRCIPQTQRVPIVALSAYVKDPQWVQAAAEAGCDDCVAKPVDWDRVSRLLLRFTPH